MPSLFVDGAEGTTGLRIHEHLAVRGDFDVLTIDPALRKDTAARADCLNSADFVILCLPDAASRESVGLIVNSHTRVIDASTAFRCDPAWAYGLPELNPGQRDRIRTANRVSVTGCHAAGFVLAVNPLVRAGRLASDAPIVAYSLTGYSGGGKALIAKFESKPGDHLSVCPYSLALQHKHLPEMTLHASLSRPPVFQPAVGRFFQGMIVSVFLQIPELTPQVVHETLAAAYDGEPAIRLAPVGGNPLLDDGLLTPLGCNGTNRVDLFVAGHDGQVAIHARLDNLGKGAAGAAIQCLNLMSGAEEFHTLRLD